MLQWRCCPSCRSHLSCHGGGHRGTGCWATKQCRRGVWPLSLPAAIHGAEVSRIVEVRPQPWTARCCSSSAGAGLCWGCLDGRQAGDALHHQVRPDDLCCSRQGRQVRNLLGQRLDDASHGGQQAGLGSILQAKAGQRQGAKVPLSLEPDIVVVVVTSGVDNLAKQCSTLSHGMTRNQPTVAERLTCCTCAGAMSSSCCCGCANEDSLPPRAASWTCPCM